MADAQCRIDRCSGHGDCDRLYEQCNCDDGWGFPNCRGDFTADGSKLGLQIFNIITIIIVVMGLLLSTWRIILLWRAKRANTPSLVGQSRWNELTRGIDSQLCCNFCVWLCFGTTLPLPVCDIFEHKDITYFFVYTCESVAAVGCALFIRVFALMIAKTSSSTQKVVRGLDISMVVYFIAATAANFVRTFTSQQTSRPGWYAVAAFDVGYTIFLIVGSFVYNVTVLKAARGNVTKLLAAANANPQTLGSTVRTSAWGGVSSPHRAVTVNGNNGGLGTVPERGSNHSPRSQQNGGNGTGPTKFHFSPQPHGSPNSSGGPAARYAMTTSPGGSGSAMDLPTQPQQRPPSSPGQYALISSPHVHSHPPALSLEGREMNRRSTLPMGTTAAFLGGKQLTINVPASPRQPGFPGPSPTNTTQGNLASPAPPVVVMGNASPAAVVVQTIPTPSASSTAIANLTQQQANLTAVVGALHGIQITGGIAILFTIVVAMGLSHETALWASVITLLSTYYVPIVIAYLLLLTMGRRPRQTNPTRGHHMDSTGGTKPSR